MKIPFCTSYLYCDNHRLLAGEQNIVVVIDTSNLQVVHTLYFYNRTENQAFLKLDDHTYLVGTGCRTEICSSILFLNEDFEEAGRIYNFMGEEIREFIKIGDDEILVKGSCGRIRRLKLNF